MIYQEPPEMTIPALIVIIGVCIIMVIGLHSCQPTDEKCNQVCAQKGATGWSRDRYGGCSCGFAVHPVNP